jgi:putative FmdB family regulatory protein
MPTYEYSCTKCAHTFETIQKIADRDRPCGEPCPACRKRKCVTRGISAPVMGADATVGPGADFKELARKMGRGLPKSARENMERAASLRGRKYGPQ